MGLASCTLAHGADEMVLDTWHDGAAPVTLPQHFDEDGHTLALTYDLDVPAAWRGRDLWVIMPFCECGPQLEVQGRVLEPVHDVERRHHNVLRWRLDAVGRHQGPVRLTLRFFPSFTNEARWVDTVPRLSTQPSPGIVWWVEAINGTGTRIAFGIMLEIGITYLAIYLLRPTKRHHLFFALQAFNLLIYDLDLMGLTQVFGPYDITAVGIAMCSAAVCSVYFLYAQFDMGSPHRGWLYLLVACSTSLLELRFSQAVLPTGTYIVALCVGAALVVNLQVHIRHLRRGERLWDAVIMLCCWLVLAVSTSGDFWAWLAGGELYGGLRFAASGMGVFAILQALLLSKEHIESQRRSAALNEELRRQVVDRSRQLCNAIALAASPPRDEQALAPGDVVQGRYRVAKVLGRGGMGTVYEVVRLADKVHAALKVTRNVDGMALARLAREAQVGASVSHPNVVSLWDVDVAEAGYVYLVMELVNGISLESWTKDRQPTAARLEVLRQIAAGVAELHRQNMIHRDLKPANVLVGTSVHGQPLVKIADFGIARAGLGTDPAGFDTPSALGPSLQVASMTSRFGPDGTQFVTPPELAVRGVVPITTDGRVAGTPPYIAPELAAGESSLSPAADIFSLGVVAYEMLEQRYPFTQVPIMSRLAHRIPSPAHPMATMAAQGIATPLADLVMRCLSFNPMRRPSAAELCEGFAISLAGGARG